MDLSPHQISYLVQIVILGAGAWFIKSMAADFKEALKTVATLKEDMAVIKARVERLERKIDP